MGFKKFIASALVAGTAAQTVPFSLNGHSISVHIPSETASTNNGSIYFQITAPSGTTWTGFGQGSQMRGANMFLIYSDGSGKVVLSPRTGTGEVQPKFDSSIQASLLDGSGVASDGSLVANVRCDTCLSWSGGTMDPKSTDANWIMSYKAGDAVGSSSQSANLQQHDQHVNFNLDLTAGTGNTNPLVQSGSQTGGASSTSGTASATSGVSTPLASNNPNANSSPTSGTESTASSPTKSPFTHGVIMSLLMVGLFPLAALTLYLPTTMRVRYIHAPLNVINLVLLIVGLAFGVTYGKQINLLGGYHQIIGYIVFALFVLPQPALGIYQHLHYHKTGQRSFIGPIHQWLGRIVLILGVVNGGLGWNLTDSKTAYTVYGVLAGVMFLIYVAVASFFSLRKPKSEAYSAEKGNPAKPPSDTVSSRDDSHPASAQ